jgi:hypothetical protein
MLKLILFPDGITDRSGEVWYELCLSEEAEERSGAMTKGNGSFRVSGSTTL